MKLLKTLLFFSILVFTKNISAQDIHFSQFDLSPLTLNPAFTGGFSGTFRLGGIYRDQWRSIKGSPNSALTTSGKAAPYTTPSFYVDSPIASGFRKNDWIGVGGMIYQDKAGTADLTSSSGMLSLAYHMGMDKKGKTQFTIGVQGGMNQRTIDLMAEGVYFENDLQQWLDDGATGPINQSGGSGASPQDASYFDVNLGVALSTELSKKSDMVLGISLNHLIKPRYGMLTADSARQSMRPNLHGLFNFGLNDKWTLSPAFMTNFMAKQKELALQGLMKYRLNPEKDMTLNFGLGYRLQDAFKLLVGMSYKDFRIGGAYDINVSDLTEATSTVGAFEIGVSYIVKIYKNPTVPPAILCPRF